MTVQGEREGGPVAGQDDSLVAAGADGSPLPTLGVAALRLQLNHLRAWMAVGTALHSRFPSSEVFHAQVDTVPGHFQAIADFLAAMRQDALLENPDVAALIAHGDTHYDAGIAAVVDLAEWLGVSAEDLLTVMLYS